jgi:hypothetical protein
MKHSYNEDGVSGYIDVINPIVIHFTCPQFAASVLENYSQFFQMIKAKVNPIYENIDAILINENDFNKLASEGYIGNKLGQFKIEHIFTEIAILTKKCYVATLINGERYFHCVKDDYDEFVQRVQK